MAQGVTYASETPHPKASAVPLISQHDGMIHVARAIKLHHTFKIGHLAYPRNTFRDLPIVA